VKVAMNLRISKNEGKFLTSWGPVSFRRIILLHGAIQSVSPLVCQVV
jgi:hypothetical protein